MDTRIYVAVSYYVISKVRVQKKILKKPLIGLLEQQNKKLYKRNLILDYIILMVMA